MNIGKEPWWAGRGSQSDGRKFCSGQKDVANLGGRGRYVMRNEERRRYEGSLIRSHRRRDIIMSRAEIFCPLLISWRVAKKGSRVEIDAFSLRPKGAIQLPIALYRKRQRLRGRRRLCFMRNAYVAGERAQRSKAVVTCMRRTSCSFFNSYFRCDVCCPPKPTNSWAVASDLVVYFQIQSVTGI